MSARANTRKAAADCLFSISRLKAVSDGVGAVAVAAAVAAAVAVAVAAAAAAAVAVDPLRRRVVLRFVSDPPAAAAREPLIADRGRGPFADADRLTIVGAGGSIGKASSSATSPAFLLAIIRCLLSDSAASLARYAVRLASEVITWAVLADCDPRRQGAL